jgi:hypothetical protein
VQITDPEIEKTLAFYKAGGAPAIGALSPQIQKDLQIATGATGTPGGTGLQQYNLYPTALTLYPVTTPIRNMTARLQGRGKQSEYKAIMGVTGGGLALSTIWGSEGTSGQKVDLQVMDAVAIYRSIKIATGISFEQQWAGQGLLDSKATAVINLLRNFMVNEELALIYGANSAQATNQFAGGAVGTVAAPALTTATTGGTVAAGTYRVAITAVTGMGESLWTEATITTTGSTSTITVTPPARGAFPVFKWNVYISQVGGGAGTSTLQGSTTGAPFVLSTPPTGTGVAVSTLTVDTTTSTKAYNGLLAQLYGSTQTAGQSWGGVGNTNFQTFFPGATIISANAAIAMTGTGNNSVETLLSQHFNNALADPLWAIMYQQEARNFTKSTLGAGTPYFIVPENAPSNATANFRVSRFVNPITGTEIVLKAHPYWRQGTVVFGTDKMPDWYVPSEIPAVFALDMLQDYLEVDYSPRYDSSGTTGDTWVVEIINMGTFKVFVPALFSVMDSIVAS